jgi:hypothetical protein
MVLIRFCDDADADADADAGVDDDVVAIGNNCLL